MSPSRKAMIEVQFSWIFILIAGALILFFFITVVQRQRTVASEERYLDIRSRLSNILLTAKQSPSTLFRVTLPKEEYALDCNGLSVGGSSIPLGEAFGPAMLPSLSGSTFLWTQAWDVPFRVENFLYLTSPEVRYVIIDDAPGLMNELYYDLPDNISKGYAPSIDNIQELNHPRVRIIYFNQDPSTITGHAPPALRGELSILLINTTHDGRTRIDGFGNVTFYIEKDGQFIEDGHDVYYGEAMLLGAVFSDRIENYRCAKARATARLTQVAHVLKKRSEYLSGYFTDHPEGCEIPAWYSPDQNGLGAIAIDALDDPARLLAGSLLLASANRALEVKSCPVLY